MIQTYQDALDYVYSFLDPARKAASGPEAAVRNLDRMRALLAAAGEPQAGLRCVVVAGTKGKGSSAAMIEAIAREAGLRTGLFTSPHLSSYRERMQVNRALIGQGELVELTARMRPLIDGFDPAPYGPPTTFDVGLLLALRHFAEHDVGLAVMEIGLGGRYDTVNVLTPLVSVISSISYDHMAILGSSLAEIAWNKAGILKPGVPAVTVPQAPEAAPALVDEAHAVGAPLWVARPEGLAREVPPDDAPARAFPVAPRPALRGAFQIENARLALGASLLLRERGLALPDAALARGLAAVSWPGRFELLPLAPPVLIDGAHNGDSARKLAAAIQAELAPARMLLVLGTSRDKDVAAIAAALVPHAAAVVLTRSRHHRAMDLDRIAAEVGRHLSGPLLVAGEVGAAIEAAREMAAPGDLICVTGSLFVAAEAREALGLAVPD